MGCLFVLVLAGVSTAMISIFRYSLLVMAVLGSLWLAALVYSAIFGHRGFGGGGNTDLSIMIAGMFITAAIIIPRYEAQKPCNQARRALTELANAENEYFSAHKAFTAELNLLNLTQKPEVYILILKADEKSFSAAASHYLCYKDKSKEPDVLMWDSARGGIQ